MTVADVDLTSKPAIMRINKARKRGIDSEHYIGATKTDSGKRTVSLDPRLVEVLINPAARKAIQLFDPTFPSTQAPGTIMTPPSASSLLSSP
ncbi:hypothetical protein AU252_22840 [Pseudarthrobacter sulfonivorans]|uniref:Uncharacterized protein n=1 Tax=Pseudarthrobacter sulfonivorans TaxID=121292 RepID=A0A0U3PMR4_9MICC|nr:hypothetical protein AU252_22840 [Pseudarthrobacter sulfonivorans]